MTRHVLHALMLMLLLSATACAAISAGKPVVIISAPPSGSTWREGDQVAVQSSSADAVGVTRVELLVDGTIARTDTPPSPQLNYNVIQTWRATTGAHTLTVRAYNASGMMSDPAAVSITVNAASGGGGASSSSAVSSVLVPSSSAASSAVPSSSAASSPASSGASSATAKPDLYVSEFALTPNPPTKGNNVHVRLGVYNQGNAAVSTPFTVEWYAGSNYATPACTWTVDSLAARGGRILECDKSDAWASHYASIATRVKVDSGNTVSESDESNNIKDTTIQVMQASSSAASSSASSSASSATAKPDLYVSEFALTPNPPTRGNNVHVRLGVYNQGNAAVSTPFTVEWWAGSSYPAAECNWTVTSLAAHGGRILECDSTDAWASHYASITTRVKIDPGNTVSESDESNNIKDTTIQVLQAASSSASSSASSATAKPDLYVSAFTLTPNPPTHNANVHVSITVYNKGEAAASTPFKVEWYAGSNYSTPACTWDLPSMAARGGRVLECDKSGAWASNYANITTRVKVDPTGAVNESDDSNNVYDLVIKVN